ncbi:hypothetical protein B2D07_04605 [Desulfococcus multivorans]|nr:hypothetical protein B2D07_04605 [Desulfococcus multivorans]
MGAFWGAALLSGPGGAVMGFAAGCLLAVTLRLRRRMGDLERRIALLERLNEPSPSTADAGFPAGDGLSTPMPGKSEHEADEREIQAEDGAAGTFAKVFPEEFPRIGGTPSSSAVPSTVEVWSVRIRAFFTEGNVVVRIGVIVLFFGVAFLLKYAAERNAFPVEFRLAVVAVGAIALLALGWRLRLRRSGYALILQGAAVGILYVTLFVAAKLYHLIPFPLALGFMVAVVALSGWLAVLQDAPSLAAFGAVGGFLAPILVSSGGGSHVMLFSYYLILNAGILGIAWFKAWRALNLIGFVFTFTIGSIWGRENYHPAYFGSTEPFLILFFLFYVAITVLFAHRQPLRLRGYVDGTLTFGVPIVVFALQARMVRGMDWGLAYSALTMGGFYIGLAALLWRRAIIGMRLLTEAFLALGVVFMSLAVPLALDGRWTAAAWALEGAALVWIGVRQNRTPVRCFGLLLQLGAGAAFFHALGQPTGRIPVLNGVCSGGLLISLAGLFSAAFLERHQGRLRRWERWLHFPMLIWGLAWWFGSGLNEISRRLSWKHERWASLTFAAFSFGGMGILCRRVAWPSLRYPAMFWLPLLGLLVGLRWTGSPNRHLFADGFGLPWVLALSVHLYLLRCFEGEWRSGFLTLWHLAGLLLTAFVLTWESAWAVHRVVEGGRVWWTIMWGITPGAAVWSLSARCRKPPWPIRRFPWAYLKAGPSLLAVFLLLWSLSTTVVTGDPAPLAYLPVLNPLEISQTFALTMILKWARNSQDNPQTALSDSAGPSASILRIIHGAVSLGVFVWLNGMTARTIHYFAGVPFTVSALYRSMPFQAAVAILWTLFALGAMVVGARRKQRAIWFTGAVLLGMVVLKLFFIDLGGSGTVARIVSFIAVGVLMLFIGYISPLPPRGKSRVRQPDESPTTRSV